VKPLRILSFRDLEYIRHYKFGGKSTISSKEYDSFWEWFWGTGRWSNQF